MAHGGYGKRRVAVWNPHVRRRSKGPGVDKKPKPKSVSLKNQIRSIERVSQGTDFSLENPLKNIHTVRALSCAIMLKERPGEVREAQEKKLEGLKKQQEIHTRLALERKIFLRDRKIKFFERRRIERRIRRLEKLQHASSGQAQDADVAKQLAQLNEYLEYVRTEKYVSLFTGGDGLHMVDRTNRLREQIKANLVAAAASGKDLEETGSEDDGLLDLSEDDFFLTGTSSDEADADDEWTDKSTREQASSASGMAVSGMSSDERNQRQMSARALMPPPRPSSKLHKNSVRSQSRFGVSSSKSSWKQKADISTSSYTSSSRSDSSFKARSSNMRTGHSSNVSSNSDAYKPRRKRRPKKKKQQRSMLISV